MSEMNTTTRTPNPTIAGGEPEGPRTVAGGGTRQIKLFKSYLDRKGRKWTVIDMSLCPSRSPYIAVEEGDEAARCYFTTEGRFNLCSEGGEDDFDLVEECADKPARPAEEASPTFSAQATISDVFPVFPEDNYYEIGYVFNDLCGVRQTMILPALDIAHAIDECVDRLHEDVEVIYAALISNTGDGDD